MKCRVPGLGPCHNLWEEFNEGLKFWLKVETVDSDNRPVRIPLPLRDHKDTTARNCPDILVDINDKVDRGASWLQSCMKAFTPLVPGAATLE